MIEIYNEFDSSKFDKSSYTHDTSIDDISGTYDTRDDYSDHDGLEEYYY